MKVLNNTLNVGHFFEKIRTRPSLLMLDYDGTLAPFVKERMQAYPYPGVKERLAALVKLKKTRTVIISGRSMTDLETLLNKMPCLELWGSHGLERKLPSGEVVCFKIDAKLYKGLEEGIKVCQEQIDPEFCEIKPFSVALHWRGMDPTRKLQAMKSIEPLWKKICSLYDLEIHRFDGGLELRLKGWNKGNVAGELVNEVPEGTLIAYLGDDLTDEEAFAALGNRGLKLLVREHFRPTLADIYLIPPQELLSFLDQWILNSG